MNRADRIKLAVLFGLNALVAVVVWLLLYWRGYAFHLAGVHFTPGILVLAVMVLADVLIAALFAGK
jgi:hypothetical protein